MGAKHLVIIPEQAQTFVIRRHREHMFKIAPTHSLCTGKHFFWAAAANPVMLGSGGDSA
jgi:hypothetical protein